MVAKNLPFGGSAGLVYRELFFYCFFTAAMLFVLGATTLWIFAEHVAPRVRRAVRSRWCKSKKTNPKDHAGGTSADCDTHELLELGTRQTVRSSSYVSATATTAAAPSASSSSALSSSLSTLPPPPGTKGGDTHTDGEGNAEPPTPAALAALNKQLNPLPAPSAMRRCPWRSWAVQIALFVTFGGLFAFWIYMSLLGFTEDSWAEMPTTWAFVIIWVLLAVATVAFPDALYVRAVVASLPGVIGFYLNTGIVHLAVWNIWTAAAAGVVGFVPLATGVTYMLTAGLLKADPDLRARVLTDPKFVQSNPVVARLRFGWRAVRCSAAARPRTYAGSLLAVAAYCTITTLAMTGGCLAFFNTRVEGGTHAMPVMSFGTWLSRQKFAAGCPDDQRGRPCHVYLSVPTNISTAMMITAHTAVGHPGLEVVFRPTGSASAGPMATVAMQRFGIGGLESNGDRLVHSALLGGLTPATAYTVVVVPAGASAGTVAASKAYKFRTGPAGTDPFSFTSGGDMGNTDEAVLVSAAAAGLEPLFSIVGGDVAYDNGMRSCYRCFDQWLSDWQATMTTPSGFTVPMMIVNGNHDIGCNSLDFPFDGIYPFADPEDERIPLSLIYFPQEDPAGTGSILPPHRRRTYHVHLVGESLVVLALDSGYIERLDGPQTDWIDATLAQYPDRLATAVYHDPIYPMVIPASGGETAAGREASTMIDPLADHPKKPFVRSARAHWVPIFDRHHLVAAFENHEHTFKRTYPIQGSACTGSGAGNLCSDTAEGTVYLGDGYWGIIEGQGLVAQEPLLRDPFPIIANAGLRYHVWRFQVGLNGDGRLGLNASAVAGVPCPDLADSEVCSGAFDSTAMRRW